MHLLGRAGFRRAMLLVLLVVMPATLPACPRSSRAPARRARVDARAGRPRLPRATGRRQVAPLLPERGPHPDYPTPVAAGSDRIFFLEEPERGPRPEPLAFVSVPGLRWTRHAHCELDISGLACGVAGASGAGAHWRLGRRGKTLVVAEERLGDRVTGRLQFLPGKDGVERVVRHDARGDVEWARYLDGARSRLSARRLTGANALPGCGYWHFTIGGGGFSAEVGCLQWLGEPMRDEKGVAVTRYQRDPRGFVRRSTRFGPGGELVANHDGVHAVRFERDAAGRPVAELYEDTLGRPVKSTAGGCAGTRYGYDAQGLLVETVCLGLDGRPAAAAWGGAVVRDRFDEHGCKVGTRYFGVDGARATFYHRVHGMEYEVEAGCEQRSRTCLNIVEQPLACGPREAARQVYRRDGHGRVVSITHFGPDGRPGRDESYEVFELRKQYDERGSLVGKSCYNAGRAPTGCVRTGFHAITYRIDEAGRDVEERFFDISGAPTTNLGASVRRFQYDNYDHVFEARNYDAGGKLLESLGAATRRELYDAGHRRFAVLLLDRACKPARYTGCYTGVHCPSGRAWHAVRVVRSPAGAVLRNQFFDAAGQLVETIQCGTVRCWS